MRSLRRTLLLTLLASTAVVTLAAALGTYRMARAQLDEIFDDHLRQLALVLRDQALGRGAPAPEDLDVVVQVWSQEGVRLYLSRPAAGLPDRAELGFATVHTGQGDWRVYSEALGAQVIQVAQPLGVRDRKAAAAAARTLLPVLLLLPLLALAIFRMVGRGLEPLARLAVAVSARGAPALDPVPEVAVPAEALPLVRALNGLLGRLAAALAAQRAMVADAAHELRTPLAALRLQAQLVERAPDEAERARALADLSAGLERATRAVQQILTLARQEPEAATERAAEPVALAALVGEVLADQAVVAEARGVDLGATAIDEAAAVRGDAGALRALLANLVDNAVRATPPGGRVDVAAGLERGRPFLSVRDTGPGIPPEERARVFDRFYRRAGAREPGTGLGLAIVRAVAERHGAEVTLDDAPGGGLEARVDFARAGRPVGEAPPSGSLKPPSSR
jgi:two-component system OmpR family sensor kinase